MVDRPNFDTEAAEKRNLALIYQRGRTILLRVDFFVADDWTYAHRIAVRSFRFSDFFTIA